MKPLRLLGSAFRRVRQIKFTKKNILIGLGVIAFLVWFVPMAVKTGWYAATAERYTATVLSAPKSDQTPALTVLPPESLGLNTTRNGEYKLLVRDVRSFLYWETRSERFESLSKGDVICLLQVHFRSGWLSSYATAVNYTRGECKPS